MLAKNKPLNVISIYPGTCDQLSMFDLFCHNKCAYWIYSDVLNIVSRAYLFKYSLLMDTFQLAEINIG